jgi:hypothetical protein
MLIVTLKTKQVIRKVISAPHLHHVKTKYVVMIRDRQRHNSRADFNNNRCGLAFLGTHDVTGEAYDSFI